MAIRTTATAVKKLLRDGVVGTDYDGSTDLTPFIETGSSIVDDMVSYASDAGLTAYSAAKLELIERWLSAHTYKMSDQAYASESVGGASGQYQGQTGLYLDGTKYGQMAKLLDTRGYLAAMEAGTPSLRWGGKRYSERIPYDQRD